MIVLDGTVAGGKQQLLWGVGEIDQGRRNPFYSAVLFAPINPFPLSSRVRRSSLPHQPLLCIFSD